MGDDFFTVDFHTGGQANTIGRDFYRMDHRSLFTQPKVDPAALTMDKQDFRSYVTSNQIFDTDFSVDKRTALPEFGGNIGFGRNIAVGNQTLGILAAAGVSNELQRMTDATYRLLEATGSITDDYTYDSYEASLKIAALGSLSLTLRQQDRINYTFFYARNASDTYMRREGYELQVGQPRVIVKEIDGKKCEPIEEMTVDCPQEYSGTVIELATKRKGTLTNMETNGDRTRLEFTIPSRGIIGLRSNMLTATAGEAIMTHRLKGFEPWTGEIEMRVNGSIISGETGTAYAYSIDKLQDRGRFFISPMEQVYEGQVIGEHTRQNDITVNVTKAKQLTNMRASGSDEKTSIAPPKVFSLEEALEYIKEDEYVEVTPHAMRLRKILLNETDRKRASK